MTWWVNREKNNLYHDPISTSVEMELNSRLTIKRMNVHLYVRLYMWINKNKIERHELLKLNSLTHITTLSYFESQIINNDS